MNEHQNIVGTTWMFPHLSEPAGSNLYRASEPTEQLPDGNLQVTLVNVHDEKDTMPAIYDGSDMNINVVMMKETPARANTEG